MLSTPPDFQLTLGRRSHQLRSKHREVHSVEDTNAYLGSNSTQWPKPEKFTPWKTHQRVLGLEFDSVAETISMPVSKIGKA
ncbi:hypothetical protein PHMEG_00018308 [Phytophthora megakarya]|uniref:Uncharacterized protein n=1 Tax=Phytophthora megakarya TaxID=4795 RepID=A0A225VU35_9STRA|nr:hypothetical protein PHMEG_00018308 [Phytophthora megakarya]